VHNINDENLSISAGGIVLVVFFASILSEPSARKETCPDRNLALLGWQHMRSQTRLGLVETIDYKKQKIGISILGL
jgi:microsomal dipeptidase-like Zn-dependent dipeptidase